MKQDNNHDIDKPVVPESETGDPKENRKQKRHLIHPTWLRVTLKTLMWIVIVILLIPVLLYLPPVQDLAVSIAKKEVKKATGMEIGIGKFRLSFPLDVHLKDVYVLTETGDTMVRAGEAVADVKLLPLLSLDVKINTLELDRGYYRMVSPDSSMLLTVNAGKLVVDDKSSMSIKRSEILLNKARLKDGRIDLYMDVWKQKPTPKDTAPSTPFYIKANDLELENFGFGMSMLPTIDTLDLAVKHVALKRGVVDLRKNAVSWKLASVKDGSVRYIQPTAEYVKTHPAPPPMPSTGPPMQILGDSIAVEGLSAIYATKGYKPMAGFDPGYISVQDVVIGMRGFYNESSTVRLPLTVLRAKERSGLQVTQGKGLIAIDSIGLKIGDVQLRTLYSQLRADADVPFALMALEPDAPMKAKASGRLGMPDLEVFLPMMKTYTSKIPARKPLDFNLDAAGSLARLNISDLNAEMSGILRLKARGYAANALDYKRLKAHLDIDGALMDPALAQQFLPASEMRVPAFTIKGSADADGMEYGADLALLTTAGDVAAKGHVALTPETYSADVGLTRVNVAQFMPSLGIGHVSGHVLASGAGFNPLSGHAVTDATVRIDAIEYNKRELRDIKADLSLQRDGMLRLLASSANAGLNFDVDASGTIKPDDYTFDLAANIRELDLMSLGLTDSLCNGKGTIYLTGTASPERWLYDADLKLVDFDWNMPNQFIHLPGGVEARIKADALTTTVNVDSHLTNVDFESPRGLKQLVSAFTATADTLTRQINMKNLAVDAISRTMPPFRLSMNASGRGLLNQFLTPAEVSMDTIWGVIERDSTFHGNIRLLSLKAAGLKMDTIGLNLSERGQLLDYKAHMGNRPGTFDDFAEVNVNGYLGHNRLGAFLTQKNIKNETGYRLGMTASLMDSVVSVHFTPLKATIAYLPWTMNNDNYLDYNFNTKQVDANLMAQSRESAILARTEPMADGGNELHVKIDNLHIQDFLNMSVFAPPITGAVSTDLRVSYQNKIIQGGGILTVKDFTYERVKVGNFDLDLKAGYGMTDNSATNILATLRINGEPALGAYADMHTDDKGSMVPDSIGVKLTHFPLKVANAFLGDNLSLGGFIEGNLRMDGSFSEPLFNGYLAFDSVVAHVPMMDGKFHLDHNPILVSDNIVTLDNFNILAANNNPLSLNGKIDATKFNNILFDLTANAQNIQLINSDKRSRGDLYGKIFLNLNATAKGPMSRLNIGANVNLLGTTDATYRLNMTPADMQAQQQSDVVKFVNFNDTTQVAVADTVVESPLNMRIDANLQISPGTQLQVLLSNNGTDKVQLQPTANLHYFQNYMGDMNMTGTLTLGEGMARYALPVIGEKRFDFSPGSTVTWTGNVMNPTLNVTATDEMKANVTQGNNSRLVNFLVTLHATNPVDQIKVAFDLSTNDDLTIQNELQAMSPDQRQTQAMNLLLYGQYVGQGGTKANANLDGNMLYSFLESQLNSWAAKNIRGVDLSFGINQYDKTTNGNTSTQTSYSYQVSKSLFNNRFKILVGGNYSTDSSPEDNLAQNLINDISFEYIIKQTPSINMSVQLFRHQGYESILEGEITETGVGFIMKRKLESLWNMFRFRRRRKKKDAEKVNVLDTVPKSESKDSVVNNVTDTVERVSNGR